MRPLRLLIRADGGRQIGGGHVMRCLTLADALAPLADFGFAGTAGTFADIAQLDRPGLRGITLDDPSDASELAQKAGPNWDVLVSDHYGLDARHHTSWRSIARVLVSLDDLADRPHDCDLLLDQTFGRRPDAYAALVPPHARVLTGATHALLRPAFGALRPLALAARASATASPRLLLSTGMGDPGGHMAPLASALLARLPQATIDAALGAAAPGLPPLRRLAAMHPGLTVHVDTPEMPKLMADATLAIGAMGSSAWERCCLGLPTLALVLADNQREAATALAAAGAVRLLAPDPDTVAEEAARLLADPATLAAMAAASATICDGQGATRTATVVRALVAP